MRWGAQNGKYGVDLKGWGAWGRGHGVGAQGGGHGVGDMGWGHGVGAQGGDME